MDSTFARGQLEKHGWSDGSGLGREETGIKEALKVKLKFDTAGVGHNAGDQFTHHWWDHMFNKAAQNINVENSKDGVKVSQTEEFNISNKKGVQKAVAGKNLLYGRFVKSATLTNDGNMQEEEKPSDSSDESDDEPEQPFGNLTDEQLFKICGGRTAHKAARHGLKLNGKLLRIQQQEEQMSNPTTPVVSDSEANSNDSMKKAKKKKKKSKNKDQNDNIFKESNTSNEELSPCSLENGDGEEKTLEGTDSVDGLKKKKKKSKKNKDKVVVEESVLDKVENECEMEQGSRLKSKKKKKRRNQWDNDVEADVETSGTLDEPVEKKRKISHESDQGCDSSSHDKAEVKKKKKKSKKKSKE